MIPAETPDPRINQVLDLLMRLAAGEMDARIEPSERDDELDAILAGTNMLAEELATKIKEINSSEARLKYLVEFSPAVIYTAQVTGNLGTTYYSENVSRQLGYTSRDFVEDPDFWFNHIHPDDQAWVTASISELFQNDKLVIEFRFSHKDGSYRWMHDEARLIRDSVGQPVEVIGSWLDITARKQAEQELVRARHTAESANRAKSEFISTLSHELRTPLNAILGFAQIIEMDADTLPASVIQSAGQIAANGRELLEMINKILDFARSDTGKLELNLQTVDACALVQDVCTALQTGAAARRIHLALNLPALPCNVHADALRLKQILHVLIHNAIEFTPAGGEVSVHAQRLVNSDQSADHRSLTDWLLVTVKDTGIGMNAEQLARLFQPLTQLDASTSRAHSGLGLELALAQQLAKLHGGRIWSESAGANQGSTFRFEIPLEA